jgi:hypothetical protein
MRCRPRLNGLAAPRRIAIVDDRPAEQYLYPEFLLAQRFFQKHGIAATIADGRELQYENGKLLTAGLPVDLVYNRLVDFALDHPEHRALRAAISMALSSSPPIRVCMRSAPTSAIWRCFDQAALRSWGLPQRMLADLPGVARTVLVTAGNEQELWKARKTLFFKPAGGHGAKAAYRGDKVTKRVWEEIVRGGYVAQAFAPPGERMIKLDGRAERRKTDIRLYTYDGKSWSSPRVSTKGRRRLSGRLAAGSLVI